MLLSGLAAAISLPSSSSSDRHYRLLLLAVLLSGDQVPRGGAAIYSAGSATFHESADFLGNGQFRADAPSGDLVANEDGGAVANFGTMTVCAPQRHGTLLS